MDEARIDKIHDAHETLVDILFADTSIDVNDERVDDEDVDDHGGSSMLKDVTAAVDICRCDPCRCDPLLNDCSVSCNPIVFDKAIDPVAAVAAAASGCNCSCSQRAKDRSSERPRCSGSAGSGAEAADVSQIKLSLLPRHSQDIVTCSPATDPDPCCIVVCLKHLNRQFSMEKPHCCV